MYHGAIIGGTGSGKTFAARQVAKAFKAQGFETLALHKPDEPWSKDEITLQTCYPEIFLNLIEEKNQQNKALIGNMVSTDIYGYIAFIEMSDAEADKYDERIHRLFSKGRHFGHKFYFLAQRAQAAHPNIRENCSELMLFSCYTKAAKLWAEEFNDTELLKASSLPPRQFYHKQNRFDPAKLRTIQI